MTLPKPEPGLVIRYAYLWLSEHRTGREDCIRDGPCAIVLAVPVPHTPHADLAEALELPAAIEHHLGLDAERSRVALSESNLFEWPGPDLRRVGAVTKARLLTVSCGRPTQLRNVGRRPMRHWLTGSRVWVTAFSPKQECKETGESLKKLDTTFWSWAK